MDIAYINKLIKKININPSRFHLSNFLLKAAKSIPHGAQVLDAGAGDCKYQPLFSHTMYDATDFLKVDKEYGDMTFICDLTSIPVKMKVYDLVVSTQVLEHTPDPAKILGEFWRILKDECELWITAPLFFEEHEIPFDYYRYTQYGLTYLLRNAGFEIIEITWLEGYFSTIAYQFKTAFKSLPLHPKYFGGNLVGIFIIPLILLLKPILLIYAILLAHLDINNKFTAKGYCKNYAIIAKKSART